MVLFLFFYEQYMETSKIIYIGELRTEAVHNLSGNKLTTDAPPDNQGKGEFFSPTDLLATSLGACMLTIMGISANLHGFNINDTRVSVTKIMGSNPRRVVEIKVDFLFPPHNYSPKERKILIAAAKECPVAKSLHPELKQTIQFNFTNS